MYCLAAWTVRRLDVRPSTGITCCQKQAHIVQTHAWLSLLSATACTACRLLLGLLLTPVPLLQLET
jgi:hypothetical protein